MMSLIQHVDLQLVLLVQQLNVSFLDTESAQISNFYNSEHYLHPEQHVYSIQRWRDGWFCQAYAPVYFHRAFSRTHLSMGIYHRLQNESSKRSFYKFISTSQLTAHRH